MRTGKPSRARRDRRPHRAARHERDRCGEHDSGPASSRAIVFATVHADRMMLRRGLAAGAYGYMPKVGRDQKPRRKLRPPDLLTSCLSTRATPVETAVGAGMALLQASGELSRRQGVFRTGEEKVRRTYQLLPLLLKPPSAPAWGSTAAPGELSRRQGVFRTRDSNAE